MSLLIQETFLMNLLDMIKPYESIRKNAIGQRDDCTTGCLIDYLYFKKSIIWLQET